MLLQRSDVYWGRRPPEALVRLQVVQEPARTRAMLVAGELHLALDRPALVAYDLRGCGEPASQLVSPGTVGFAPRLRDPDRDLAEATTAPTLLDRRQALQRAMERVMADLPMVPLVVPHDLYVLRRDVAWTPRLDGRVLAADLGRKP
jgi:hypothetical protein